jgi:hypothetical protein
MVSKYKFHVTPTPSNVRVELAFKWKTIDMLNDTDDCSQDLILFGTFQTNGVFVPEAVIELCNAKGVVELVAFRDLPLDCLSRLSK